MTVLSPSQIAVFRDAPPDSAFHCDPRLLESHEELRRLLTAALLFELGEIDWVHFAAMCDASLAVQAKSERESSDHD